MQKGRLIVLEGIDGTGKSTQARRLVEFLRQSGLTVVASREPTDGPWGKIVRESATTGRLTPEQELEHFLLDRRQHVDELISPALNAGKTVVLDRYYFSTMAYQGACGFDPAEIRKQNEMFAPPPDLLLLLDLPVNAALKRIHSRGDSENAFEKRESLERCRDIFLSLQHEPYTRLIDATQSFDEVSQAIQKWV